MHEDDLFAGLSGRSRRPAQALPKAPLIVAIHGGTYTSAYFDLPGFSLLDRAAALGIPIIAPDRPGYGTSPMLPPEQATIAGQAGMLAGALEEAWKRHGQDAPGIVLIGHSIGAAIVASIAARKGNFPLIGLAMSGVGMRTPGHYRDAWNALPNTPRVEMPGALKDDVMFGPVGSFGDAMPVAGHAANAPAPRPELLDIVSTWVSEARDILGRITVPVHYRQAQYDKLWVVDQGEVDSFAQALSASPRVDAAMARDTGHCIDFHHAGAALQVQQLGFALQCGVECG